MITIPTKTKERISKGVKRFQPILTKAHDKDINESDTVTIIVDILAEVFGYNKFSEITSEYAVKKTYCDLAIEIDGTVRLLIEIKAAGLNLKDDHVKQAINYCSNSGVEWVVLTNSIDWRIYKVIFAKPIDMELVYEFNLTHINTKKQSDLELLYYLTREAMAKTSKASLDDFHQQKQLINRFMLSQIILSESVLDSIRKTVKKISPETKITNDEIYQIVVDEVLKREVLDGDKANEARKKVTKYLKPILKPKNVLTLTNKAENQ